MFWPSISLVIGDYNRGVGRMYLILAIFTNVDLTVPINFIC